MGSSNFVQTYRTDKGVREAYREAVEDAYAEYGHSGYNGSISTTEGVIVTHEGVHTQSDAENLIGASWDEQGKWGIEPGGNVGAIAVHGERQVSKRVVTITAPTGITVSEALAKVKLRKGERVFSTFQVYGKFDMFVGNDDVIVDAAAGVKVNVTPAAGTARTVYRLFDKYDYPVIPAGSADTLAKARAQFSELIESRHIRGGGSSILGYEGPFTVRGVQVKGDTEDLLTITDTPKRSKVELVVTVLGYEPTEQRGWMFWGWAKS